METMLKRYRALTTELANALDTKYGSLHWHALPGEPDSVGTCTSGMDPSMKGMPGGATVDSKILVGDTLPKGVDVGGVKALLEKVFTAHGFTHFQIMGEEPGRLVMYADDKYGTQFQIGYHKKSVIQFFSGCFKWDKVPGPHDKF